jgi:hypothetical protein
MGLGKSKRITCALIGAVLSALTLAACGGGSSQQARALLRQTFKGTHQVNSGKLAVRIAVAGSGSKAPFELDFGGPFQSQGKGTLPKSDFTINLSALGGTATLGVISTGTNGYVSLQGSTYRLPASTFHQLESSFSSTTGTSSGSSSGVLSNLGIDPLAWVTNPTVVGNDTVGGANTTHVHGDVAITKLLADLSTVLQKASSLGISSGSKLASGISSSTRAHIAREVKHPTLDVWTGTSDHTLRKLEVGFDLPVKGTVATLLGGLNSARVSLLLQYTDINQPQTITAPTSAKPFSQFVSKVDTLVQGLQGTAAAGTPSTGSSSASSKTVQRYTQCIQSAGGDVAKMQRCASILNGQ